jgi:hypothetical protein
MRISACSVELRGFHTGAAQAFNDKLEALKAAAGTQPRLAMPKGASPLDAGSLLEGATPLGGKYGPGTGGSVDDEKDNSRLPLQIGAVLIVRRILCVAPRQTLSCSLH